MKFDDYFPHAIEYPDPTEIDMTAKGWRFDYISSTFLNGWINYVRPVRAFVVSRYDATSKSKLEEWIATPPHDTQLGDLGDDVFILARDDDARRLWFFWFDCDVSDCSIGCLDVDPGDHGAAEEAFVEYVGERGADFKIGYGGCGEAVEIPLVCIRGWVQF